MKRIPALLVCVGVMVSVVCIGYGTTLARSPEMSIVAKQDNGLNIITDKLFTDVSFSRCMTKAQDDFKQATKDIDVDDPKYNVATLKMCLNISRCMYYAGLINSNLLGSLVTQCNQAYQLEKGW